jgi:ABC-type phosphate transport system permease subunit
MLRTGNYELTNEHFNWVADYEIAEGGESQPPQGALIERIAWGRFYGRPQSLLVTHRRSAGQDERELELLAEFIRGRQIAGSSVEKSSQIDDRLRELDSALQQKRDRATRAFVERFAKTTSDGQRLTFHTASGEEKTDDELSAGDPLAAASISVVDPDSAWAKFQETHPQVLRWRKQRERLEKRALGKQFARQEAARLDVRQAELEHELTLLAQAEALLQVETQSAVLDERLAQGDEMVTVARRHFGPTSEMAALTIRLRETQRDELKQEQSALTAERTQLHSQLDRLPSHAQQVVLDYVEVERTAAAATGQIRKSIDELRELGSRYQLKMVTADGQTKTLAANDIVRAFQPNRLSRSSAFGVYLSRWWEFITQEPREANSEGGVMPAIWGTVVMTLIMSLAVVPCGVVAALYLREYAKSGPVISAIRIAINNLAGVPSIVFGVFGLGFFCYVIGAYIDGGPGNAGIQPLPPVRWYLTLAGLAVAATTGFLLGLASLRNGAASRRRWRRLAAYGGLASWLVATLLLIVVLFKSPDFHGLYEANLPNPHWGKGGVVWASLTLALLTLPVVIVATEEALSAVPNSMREGSFGCGASRWQTIWRIVLPHAMPGIMTGMILAMARGAGEVAPLMLVGAVKLAPELPIDLTAPFLHGSRSFMHLGFHIFDVGFQSQNSEAAKPMVYTTTLLLILIITLLNLLAVRLRAYLRQRFVTGHF